MGSRNNVVTGRKFVEMYWQDQWKSISYNLLTTKLKTLLELTRSLFAALCTCSQDNPAQKTLGTQWQCVFFLEKYG